MQIIIGLGKAGCNIADMFVKHPQYEVYKIDADIKGDNCISLKHQTSPENYEKKFISRTTMIKGISRKEILFITSCGHVSGAALRILQQLKKKNCIINVLYIKPDGSLLSHTKSLQQNLLFNVLQEYARSGVFKRLYFIDNVVLSTIVGNVPLREYYNRLNDLIVSTVHMINVFDNSDSEIDTFSDMFGSARLLTIGIYDYDSNEEKLFFSLDNIREKRYYYGVNEKTLDSDMSLRENIVLQLKNNSEDGTIKMSYGVYATQYDKNYVYCLACSSRIQKREKTA